MFNKEFLTKLPKEIYVIWWSSSIKAQIKWFREPKDIDLEINANFWDITEFLIKKYWWIIDESKYWNYAIYICKFSDWSSIDFILYHSLLWWTININWLNYRSVADIISKKIELINNSSKNEEFKNKHVQDILWLLNNGFKIIKN